MTVERIKEILRDRIDFLQCMVDAGTDFHQDGYEHELFAVKMVLHQIEHEEREEKEKQ